MDVRAKVLQYETFINEVLKEDLRKCLEEREKVCARLSEFLQLRTIIERIQEVQENKETFRTQVDLGCNFYVQAVVPDPSKVCVQVGLGFFVEFTHEEALWFVGRREAMLEQDLKRLSDDSANIKAHIQMVLQCLRELLGLPMEADLPNRRDIL